MSEELRLKLDEVIEESKKVHDAAAAAERARTRLQRVTFVLVGFAVVVLLGVLWIGLGNRALATSIADCTTAGGECYERSQSGIQVLIDAQIAAVECQTAVDVRACVEQKLQP